MIGIKTAPSLLILMGSLDWLTTIVGIVCFGAVEGNPFLAGLASTNLPVFTAIKLGTAVFVGFLFYRADKTLNQAENKSSKGFKRTRLLLKVAFLASAVFLLFAVLNNVLTVASSAR
jgi:4-hydroxybenzoate polyprenyltransferase